MDLQVLEVSGLAGEEITLPIGGGMAGYDWQLDCPPGVEPVGETVARPPSRLGDPTASNLLVRASEPGVYAVTARLARPWEDTAIRTVRVRLTVS